VGLWISRTRGLVGDRVPRHAPSLHFDTSAPETWLLRAPVRPRRRPIVQRRLTRGIVAAVIPRPVIQEPIIHCTSQVALPPYSPPRPFCDVLGAPPPLRRSIVRRRRWGPGIVRGRPAIALPPPLCAPVGMVVNATGTLGGRRSSAEDARIEAP